MREYAGAIALVAAVAACGEDGGRATASGGSGIGSVGDGEASGGDEGGPTGDEAGSADASGSGGGDGPLFDIGGGEGGTGGGEQGCKKVDFLFVIDNSASMEDDQATLVAAFPGFMDAIMTTLAADSDYHVMVVDTDPWGRCDTANPWNGMDPGSDLCNAYIQQTVFEECDRTRGAGVVHPAGDFATNAPCTIDGGNRYMLPTEPDLAGTFACTATVGVAGHPSERPMEAIVSAMAPEINAPGGCNAGFLRDDALLVITFLSDDPNYEDTGTPDDWYQAVVDAKLGDPTSVVVLGLTPDWPGCQDGGGPPKGAHWAEFIALWGDHGMHGNICGTADEFVAFFESAVGTIDQACDDYHPPG
jgi:hypothetical protein